MHYQHDAKDLDDLGIFVVNCRPSIGLCTKTIAKIVMNELTPI
ncbi:hypothetical protein ACTXHP_18780 [Bacillus stercoris]|nr:hypothetical protein [Bacillus sp. FMQ74]